ncbi:f-box-like domain-containing protein [Ditylenchus destructor]|uniref:F-box-like domain-containing protein n=1 Tax=Ditylenchus destructor TaxID=166010 RepID=A0AAD4R6Y8_9BILA|nr:f-box-like domain-containing protein [Ditylenchus destructor]
MDAIAKNVLDALSQEVMPSYDKLGSLPPDILVLVFNCLPAADRIRAERVCKNWQRLIKLYGWTSFRVANDNTVTNRGWRHLDKLLDRCATHIKELDLHGQRIITCWAEILHRLPNLRHLALTHVNLFPKDVSTLADSYPKIKSLSFSDMGESTFDNISSLLGRCPNLEHVSFEKYWFNFASFSFDGLSPTVKSIEMSDDHYCMELFPEVKRRNIMIESLVLKCRYRLNEIELQQLMTLDISSLKYLDISLNQVTRLQFVDFIPQLSKLQGLEVHVVGSDGKNCLNEYFNTDANIKPKEIVKALESCKTLRTILCESDGSIDYTEILQYFTASHQNEGEPSGPNDNRIAHLYFGFQRPENHVEHKWAKFYWRDNALPESPVVLKLRRSVLSEPPLVF